ncbi:MAG: hypothetical protein AAGB05_17770 [Pseudomonadota bacterium]
MSAHAERHSSWSLPSLALAPFNALVWFIDALPRAQHATETYSRLSSLSDETLARKGLTRADLPKVAFERGFGR